MADSPASPTQRRARRARAVAPDGAFDPSARSASAEALRRSEAQYRSIIRQAAAGLAHCDLAGRITLVNPRFAQLVGRSEEALVGSSIFDLDHHDDVDRHRAAFAKMIAEGGAAELELRMRGPDGADLWVSTVATPSLDGDGRAASAVLVVLDIKERRRSQEALRSSEERFRLVVENAREYAIVSMDLARNVTGWNIGAELLTGFSEAEIVGHTADVIFTEEDRRAGAPEREATLAIAEGRAADERWHRRKDATRFWGSGVMMAMRDGSAPLGLVKIFRDHTHVRAAQEALETSRAELVQALVDNRRARAEAEAASVAKDRFLAILSHELRTPLTPVVLALHALERNPELPASARATVELIRRNVKAELLLIDDLLDVTRISSGKLEMARAETDMHEVIRAALAVCEGDFTARRQRLALDLRAARHIVPGDAARLQQVVWNLLKNAAKFTPAEGAIRVTSTSSDAIFELAIADSGIGISAEALPLIFDAFAQEGQWVTHEFGGLGLGLAIARATVQAHHGTLVAASAGRDRGATFTMTLPLE